MEDMNQDMGMKKSSNTGVWIAVIIVVLAAAGITYASYKSNTEKAMMTNDAMMQKDTSETQGAMMEKKDGAMMQSGTMKGDTMPKEGDAMMKADVMTKEDAMMKQ